MNRTALALLATSLTVLVATVNPAAAQPGRGRGGAPVSLPDGPGRAEVQEACARCHGLGQIVNSWGYSKEGWRTLFSSMVTLTPDQAERVAAYLGTHFPERPHPRAVILPGPVSLDIREWSVPSLGSRPHDPLWASDGSIWWTGQWANVLGRLDPKTGQMTEFPLKTPNSGPHGLAEDVDGRIWYTGNAAAHVGILDPKTGQVRELPTANPEARDPHTPVFDRAGRLWFTLQRSNMVGRVDPRGRDNWETTLVLMPTPESLPYGVRIDSTGAPFVVLFGTNKIARLDPDTMAVREFVLPNAASRPRRLAMTDDDMVWYADYSRGHIGRLDPKTGAVKEWPSPSGASSQPYGIAASNGVIWYSESAVRPNTLVRFDPKTEQFQSWPIPSGGGVVRHMVATPEGNLVLACSGVNRIALVAVK